MAKESQKIVSRFRQLLRDTKFEDKTELLCKILELAFEDNLFETPAEE